MILTTVSTLALPAHADEDGSWADFESRIQYAYYTEDARALANLAQLLAAGEGKDPWRDYYRALAQFRMTSLAAATPQEREAAAEGCADAASRATTAAGKSSEPVALEAACLEALGGLRPLRAPLALNKARKRMALALQLAPANPRTLLMEAADQRSEDAEKTLRKSIARFEAERQGLSRTPAWGAADAYLALGRVLFQRGDLLAARDAVEHALLIAPEFAAARKLLSQITTG